MDEEEESLPRAINPQFTPQYEGEDVSPTTNNELLGWFSYGWAAEVFVVCAMGAFLPITLEQMARDRGYLLADPSVPCTPTWKTSGDITSMVTHSIMTLPSSSSSSSSSSPSGNQCFIWLFNHKLNTASFAMYTFSISVGVQSLLIISMSAAADHGKFRKQLLLVFAFVGSISLMLFMGITARFYLIAGLIAIISNTCFGASFVLLNSFLPLLVRHHPRVKKAEQQHQHQHQQQRQQEVTANTAALSSEHTPLLQRDTSNAATELSPSVSIGLALSTRISSWGIGIGYVGSLISLMISLGLVVVTGSTTFSLRLALFGVGLWWFVFTIPAALYLRSRPGPSLPGADTGGSSSSSRSNTNNSSKTWLWLQYLTFSWKSLGRTALKVRYLKDVLIFLLAWFCLSDGIATVSGTAVLFAKTQLNMSVAALGMINVTAMLSGVFGAFMWNVISSKLNWTASQTIVACICLFEIIPIYGLLGFVPHVQQFGHFGLQEPWEMYPLGAAYGIVMGGLSSYCRSFFGELIPPNFEASFYALYAITDKGSSIFGPAVVGMIIDRYGQIRPAFWFLAVLILVPLPLMLLVDVDRGKRDAMLLSRELEGKVAAAVRSEEEDGAIQRCEVSRTTSIPRSN
ncbi:Autophagy protein 22 [Ascosphaera aggregata]|nr:Autophagy protein 22 [Ascosphaera aggregata]